MIIVVFRVDLYFLMKIPRCQLEGCPAVVEATIVCCGFCFLCLNYNKFGICTVRIISKT